MAYVADEMTGGLFLSIGSPSPIYAGWCPWIHHTRPNKRRRTWILLYGFTCPETSWDGVCLMTQRVARVDDLASWRTLTVAIQWWPWNNGSAFSLVGFIFGSTWSVCYGENDVQKFFFLWQPKHQLSVIMELCTCGHLCMGYFSARSVWRQIWYFVFSLRGWCNFDVPRT